MELKNFKIKTTSAAKKKPRDNFAGKLPLQEAVPEPRDSLQSQVLSWDGLSAALSFSVPFVVVIAINFQSGLALTAILLAVLLPVSLLRFSLREKLGLPAFLVVPICALVSVGVTSFAAVIIRRFFPQINDSMGIYIYLLAAYPVAAAVFYGKPAKKLRTTLVWALRNVLYFGAFVLVAGIIREFLAYNRLIGLELGLNFKLEGAKMPFFGFIVFAFILAAATQIHMLIRRRRAHLHLSQAEQAPDLGEQPEPKTSD